MALTPDSFGDDDSSPPPPLDIPAAASAAAASAAASANSNGRAGFVEVVGLKHNPGIFLHWTAEEQAILEDTLPKVALDPPLLRYAKIAMLLEEKTTREVALRVRWMIMQTENGKRRKEDHTSTGRNKHKKVIRLDRKSGKSQYRSLILVGCVEGFCSCIKIAWVNGEAKVMKQMPPLPVKLNESLRTRSSQRGQG